ncbi:MAG: hypothetical protein Q6373_004705 [Candidatus Sigynarchaeota archaeon]
MPEPKWVTVKILKKQHDQLVKLSTTDVAQEEYGINSPSAAIRVALAEFIKSLKSEIASRNEIIPDQNNFAMKT